MLGISGIRSPSAAGASLRTLVPAPAAAARPHPDQEITAVAPAAPNERPRGHSQRPSAAFLAHLLATRAHEPQTRERRRAAPQIAQAAYRTAAHRPPPSGLLLRTSA